MSSWAEMTDDLDRGRVVDMSAMLAGYGYEIKLWDRGLELRCNVGELELFLKHVDMVVQSTSAPLPPRRLSGSAKDKRARLLAFPNTSTTRIDMRLQQSDTNGCNITG